MWSSSSSTSSEENKSRSDVGDRDGVEESSSGLQGSSNVGPRKCSKESLRLFGLKRMWIRH